MNALGAASDVAITGALSFYLWTSKSGMKKCDMDCLSNLNYVDGSHVNSTDAIMDRLILFFIRTGLLTT